MKKVFSLLLLLTLIFALVSCGLTKDNPAPTPENTANQDENPPKTPKKEVDAEATALRAFTSLVNTFKVDEGKSPSPVSFGVADSSLREADKTDEDVVKSARAEALFIKKSILFCWTSVLLV